MHIYPGIYIILHIDTCMDKLAEQYNPTQQQSKQQPLEHETNLTLNRINADNSGPRDLLCFWLIFLGILVVATLLAIFVAPKQIVIKTNETQLTDTLNKQCTNPCGFENETLICNPFGKHNPNLGLMLRNINVLHQFALIYLKLNGNDSGQVKHSFVQEVEATLYSMELVKDGGGLGRFVKKDVLGTKKIQLKDENQQNKFTFYGQKIEHLIGFYREVSHPNYLLVLRFANPDQLTIHTPTPTLHSILISPSFSLFIIIVRITCFAIAQISGIVYAWHYKKMEKKERTLEQKFVLVMSGLVLVFDDPLYFVGVFRPNVFMSVCSAVFVSQFIAFLFLFWITLALRILKQQSQLTTILFSTPKIILLVLYFFSYFAVLCWYYSDMAIASYEGNFIISPQQLAPGLTFVFQIWLIINFTIYAMIVINIFQKGGAILWRNRSWLYFNFYFILLVFIFLLLTGSFYEQSSKLLLLTFISLNMYCIYMQYMFTPSMSKSEQNLLVPVSEDGALAEVEGEGEEEGTVVEMEEVGYGVKMGFK